MRNLFFGQRHFGGCHEHGQNSSATPTDREVTFPPRNLVRLERLFVVRRNQFGVGTLPCAAVIESIQGVAHPPREGFFSMAIA